MRIAVASLFVASVVAAGVVSVRQDDGPSARSSKTVAATTTSVVPPTTAAPPVPTTTAAAVPAAPAPALPSGDAKVLVSPTGVVVPVTGKEAGGWRVETPCGNTAVLAAGTPIGAATVVLDAGHGGDEAGAKGANGLTEKVLNLAVAHHAKAALARDGIDTVLTRTGDYRMTIGTRARTALALSPRAFVSVHHNAEPDGPWPGPGTETYYQVASADSRRLAGLVYEEVVKALVGYQVPWVADTDAGAKYRRNSAGDDYYGLLRRSHGVPAVLAELGFISNPPEADLYNRPDVQQVEGEAVARAIVRYLRTPDPGSGFVEPYPRNSPAGPGGGSAGCVDPQL